MGNVHLKSKGAKTAQISKKVPGNTDTSNRRKKSQKRAQTTKNLRKNKKSRKRFNDLQKDTIYTPQLQSKEYANSIHTYISRAQHQVISSHSSPWEL